MWAHSSSGRDDLDTSRAGAADVRAWLADGHVATCLVLAATLAALYWLKPLSPTAMDWLANQFSTVPWLALAVVSLLVAGAGATTQRARRFWVLLAAGWGAWLVAELLKLLGVVDEASLAGSTTVDLLYVVYYLGWQQALEVRPQFMPEATPAERARRVARVGRALFVVGLLAYFIVAPRWLAPPLYGTWIPSYRLYHVLDLYVLVRLLASWRHAANWRPVFALLAGAAGMVLINDVLELLWILGTLALPGGEAIDFSWFLPMFFVVLAARAPRHLATLEPGPYPGQPDQVRAVPLLVYSLLFPVIHLGLGLVEPSPPELERAQNALVLGWLLLLGGMNIVQYRRIQRVNEDLDRRRRDAERQLQFLSRHDPLTGLPNRRQIEDGLAEAIARCRREDRLLAVLFLDLNGFKSVNDQLGHAAGDRILCRVADRLRSCVRQGELAGRYGGDEFVVVLENVAGPEDAQRVAQRIHQAFADVGYGDDSLEAGHVTAALGIAIYPRDGTLPDDLIMAADHAMYADKRS